MRERLFGYLIAGGVAALAFAGYRWFAGQGDVAVIAVGGAALTALGFWLSGRDGEESD